jgi:hypothetical protein
MTPTLLTTATHQLMGMGALMDFRPLAAPVQLQTVRPRIDINVRAHATTQPVTMMAAVEGSTTLDPSEIMAVIQPLRRAIERLRLGQGTFDDFARAASIVNIGLAIERKGVIRGLQADLDDCHRHLEAIGQRGGEVGTWQPPTLWAAEIRSLNVLANLHEQQLQVLSYREYSEARDYAVAKVRSAGGLAWRVPK